jgi:hypothetical protein
MVDRNVLMLLGELTLELPLWDGGRFFVLRLETRWLALSDFTSCIHDLIITFAKRRPIFLSVPRVS